ncbi:MAG: hypothetical protein ACR2IT_09030, partial [Pirellulales bacterium]
MSLSILGIGTAVPDHAIAQGDAAGLALAFANAPPGRERALAAIYRQSGIRTRGSVLLEAATGGFDAQTFFPAADSSETRPTTGDRMARYAIEAGRLAIMAAGDAVCASGVAADEFT